MGKNLIFVKTLIAIVIGAALMFVLNRFATIDTGVPDTYISFGFAILAAVAAIFGPVAGFLTGFTGHFLVDLSWGGWGGLWWSWVICSGIFGLAVGACRKKFQIEEGGFGVMQATIFNGVQIAANVLVWGFLARTLDMIIYKQAFGKVSIQGFAAAGVNSAAVLVLGTLLIIVYSKIAAKTGGRKA